MKINSLGPTNIHNVSFTAEQIGCDHCNYHGTCFSRNDEEMVCECFQWYGGATCQLNLKGIILLVNFRSDSYLGKATNWPRIEKSPLILTFRTRLRGFYKLLYKLNSGHFIVSLSFDLEKLNIL